MTLFAGRWIDAWGHRVGLASGMGIGGLGALPALFWNTGGWVACVLLAIAVQGLTVVLALRFWRKSVRHVLPVSEGIS